MTIRPHRWAPTRHAPDDVLPLSTLVPLWIALGLACALFWAAVLLAVLG